MNTLGLSAQQLAERRLRLHAGDAAALMAGDFRTVYRRVKGLDPDTDLSGEFRVQLGSYTEPFNLAWTMRETGRPITYYSANPLMREIWHALTDGCLIARAVELVVHRLYPFMACNLDGMTTTPQGHRAVIDAKHVGRSTEAEILRYTPAGVWQASCAGTDWWGLSMIVGNKWEPPIFQEVDPIYQATMIARAKECWGYIERDEEPPEVETAVLPPKPQPRLRSLTIPVEADEVYEAMARQDNWLPETRKLIYAFVDTHPAATKHAIVREELKGIVPPSVGEINCGRYRFRRTKAGAVTQSLAKMEWDNADD